MCYIAGAKAINQLSIRSIATLQKSIIISVISYSII